MSHQLNAQCPFHYMWGSRKSNPAGDEDQGAPKKESEAGNMPPPPIDGEMATYFHVGGWAKELLTYGFQLDAWQMQCCSKSREKLYISSFGEGYPTAKSVFGGVQGIHKSRNFHISYGWLSSQDFLNEFGFQGRGLGGSWYATIKSVVGNKNEMLLSSKILGGFEKSRLKTELMVPIYKDPLCIGYFLVSPIQNWLLGYRGVYNFDEKEFQKHGLCLGYYNGITEVGMKLENFNELRGSIFYRLGKNLAFALKANLYNSEDDRQFVVGAQYMFQYGSLLKVKIRDDAKIGLVYQSKLSPNIDVLYHIGLEGSDPLKGAHKLGVSCDFHC